MYIRQATGKKRKSTEKSSKTHPIDSVSSSFSHSISMSNESLYNISPNPDSICAQCRSRTYSTLWNGVQEKKLYNLVVLSKMIDSLSNTFQILQIRPLPKQIFVWWWWLKTPYTVLLRLLYFRPTSLVARTCENSIRGVYFWNRNCVNPASGGTRAFHAIHA